MAKEKEKKENLLGDGDFLGEPTIGSLSLGLLKSDKPDKKSKPKKSKKSPDT